MTKKDVVSWAWGLGYRIAMPIVFFALLGRWLDKLIATEPVFLLVGIGFSLITTVILLRKYIKDIIK